jgi:hypothetical protein
MTKKPAPAAPESAVALYAALVKAVPGAELKGASMPYTSVNGNMHSFLDRAGVAAIRLGAADREAFIAKFGGDLYVHETGTVMKEYVPLPATLLAAGKAAAAWLKKSLAYAKTLKPKATARKKTAA